MEPSKRTLLAVGTSLWPFVRSGSRLELETVSAEAYGPGDLVVYCGAGVQICHRVLRRKLEGGLYWFYLKGDGRAVADGWIPEYRLIGRVARLNGRSLAEWPLRALSRVFFWHSRLQSAAYEALFESRLGVWGRGLRERWATSSSFAEAFAVISAPWAALRGRA